MGQAKKRGNYNERRKLAQEKDSAEKAKKERARLAFLDSLSPEEKTRHLQRRAHIAMLLAWI